MSAQSLTLNTYNRSCVNLSGIISAPQSVVEPISPKYHSSKTLSQSYENFHGVDWHYFLVPNQQYTSLIDKIGEELILQKFVVCLNIPSSNGKNKHFFTAFDSHLDFIHYIKNIPREQWCFFEVILGDQPQKLYFDIELYVSDLSPHENVDSFCNRLLTNLVSRIIDTFNEHNVNLNIDRDILLFSSSNNIKKSYHVIVDNYAVINNIENKALAGEILNGFPQEYSKFIDKSMYSSKQQLRLFQSQKPGSGRPKIFVGEWMYGSDLIKYPYQSTNASDDYIKEAFKFTTLFSSSCVTVTSNCKIISISPKIQTQQKIFKSSDEGDCDIMTEEVIKAIPMRINPAILQIYSIYKTTGSLISLKRQKPAKCTLCNRIHENENAFLRVSRLGKVYFHCRRNDQQSRIVADVSDLIPGADLTQNHALALINNIKKNISPPQCINLEIGPPSVRTLHSQIRDLSNKSYNILRGR